MTYSHISVLTRETIESLNVKKDGIYLDGTLGGGGHSSEILKQLDNGLLICMDKDMEAISHSREKLKKIGGNFVLAKGNFLYFDKVLNELEIDKLDGAVLDLGVSSYQLDEVSRGFSYKFDAKLDMRMNQGQKKSAKNVVNEYSKKELEEVIFKYGEEKWASRIAEFIVDNRPVETTFELVDIIKKAVPVGARDDKHPARRTFQAIRIEVNDELEIIGESIEKIVDKMKVGGRLAVISFHSLEDRIVKKKFVELSRECVCPPEFPVCTCGNLAKIKIITRKPIVPSLKELKFNSRSRSAKLRVIERL